METPIFMALALIGVAPVTSEYAAASEAAVLALPRGIGPDVLGVIVNDADPLSVKIGEYYQARRSIPDGHMIHVRFTPGSPVMGPQEFEAIKAQIDAQVPAQVQAYALTWVKPWRVDCMSITTAFAAGFDQAFCARGCIPTRVSPYYNSDSWAPFRHYQLRPAMSIAALDFEGAKRLIDRALRSDASYPRGTGYLLDTTDKNRNARAPLFDPLVQYLGRFIHLEHVHADYIENKPDVLFYFTGLPEVPKLQTNGFVPGAIADHLTSAGGVLTDSAQMSSLRWLEAGAAGSYGTVVEPCAFPAKFPNPAIVISRYLRGESLIEAYWKSVAMPGQGIFLGEPLARPYGGTSRPGE